MNDLSLTMESPAIAGLLFGVGVLRVSTMKDRDFLMWLHERLEHVHGECPLVDYMHKLRAIIRATPAEQLTPNCEAGNNLETLRDTLADSVMSQPQVDDKCDAERYRWLRSQHWSESPLCVVAQPREAVKLGRFCPSMEHLDAAVDEAMMAPTGHIN